MKLLGHMMEPLYTGTLQDALVHLHINRDDAFPLFIDKDGSVYRPVADEDDIILEFIEYDILVYEEDMQIFLNGIHTQEYRVGDKMPPMVLPLSGIQGPLYILVENEDVNSLLAQLLKQMLSVSITSHPSMFIQYSTPLYYCLNSLPGDIRSILYERYVAEASRLRDEGVLTVNAYDYMARRLKEDMFSQPAVVKRDKGDYTIENQSRRQTSN